MARADEGSFFDVLIDRLVADVRREFEAGLHDTHADTKFESASPRDAGFNEDGTPRKVASPAGFDDLVSKMVGFRARMTTQAAPPVTTQVQKFSRTDVEHLLSSAKPKMAQPKFVSSDAEVAYALVIKAGAKFLDQDLDEQGLTAESLKRERRRVLLTLHPDRFPEAERGKAHQSFLAAAEAFTHLAEALSDRASQRPKAA